MKKILRFIFLSLVFFLGLGTRQAKATHIMGMDVSWRCMGNDTYEIKLVVYRRCTDGASLLDLSTTPPLILGDSCSNSDTLRLGAVRSYTVEDITPICSSQPKICPMSGGSGISTSQLPVGVERHTVIYHVYFGNTLKCCWYRIRWQLCCRNSNISTGLGDADFYSDSWLNRCVAKCNNGPEFVNSPMIIACAGQDVYYNHGVQEPDGDSLSYSMAPPLGGNYVSPWSYNYPLTCLSGNNPNPLANPPTGFNLNTVNGDISFRPMQVQITVLKVMVTEWRKDSNGKYVTIGKTARDMQFVITQNCSNKSPVLTGPFDDIACAGQQFCKTFQTIDPDGSDTTRIYWDRGIKPGTWTDNNGTVRRASGTFCWTPDFSDTSSLPYYFTAIVYDNHCAVMGYTAHSYSILVRPSPENIRSYTKLTCSIVEFKATPKSAYFNSASYKWYEPKALGTGSPVVVYATTPSCQYTFTQGGSYLIKNTMFFNGCTTTYFDTLTIDSTLFSHISTTSDTVLCPGDMAVLTADSALNYQWYNDATPIPGATSRTYNAFNAGKYFVTTSLVSCFNKSNIINIYEIKSPVINKTAPLCIGDTVTYSAYGKSGATFQWYKNGIPITGSTLGTLTVTQDGIYSCKITQTGCTIQSKADTVVFLALPSKPGIIMNGTILFSSTAVSYQWYYGTTLINGATSVFYNPPKTGNYSVKVTGANGCSVFSDPFTYNVGIKFNPLSAKIKISPNPFQNYLSLIMNGVEQPVNFRLYNIQGKLLMQENSVKNSTDINTSGLSSGLYLLEISDGAYKITYKVEKR